MQFRSYPIAVMADAPGTAGVTFSEMREQIIREYDRLVRDAMIGPPVDLGFTTPAKGPAAMPVEPTKPLTLADVPDSVLASAREYLDSGLWRIVPDEDWHRASCIYGPEMKKAQEGWFGPYGPARDVTLKVPRAELDAEIARRAAKAATPAFTLADVPDDLLAFCAHWADRGSATSCPRVSGKTTMAGWDCLARADDGTVARINLGETSLLFPHAEVLAERDRRAAAVIVTAEGKVGFKPGARIDVVLGPPAVAAAPARPAYASLPEVVRDWCAAAMKAPGAPMVVGGDVVAAGYGSTHGAGDAGMYVIPDVGHHAGWLYSRDEIRDEFAARLEAKAAATKRPAYASLPECVRDYCAGRLRVYGAEGDGRSGAAVIAAGYDLTGGTAGVDECAAVRVGGPATGGALHTYLLGEVRDEFEQRHGAKAPIVLANVDLATVQWCEARSRGSDVRVPGAGVSGAAYSADGPAAVGAGRARVVRFADGALAIFTHAEFAAELTRRGAKPVGAAEAVTLATLPREVLDQMAWVARGSFEVAMPLITTETLAQCWPGYDGGKVCTIRRGARGAVLGEFTHADVLAAHAARTGATAAAEPFELSALPDVTLRWCDASARLGYVGAMALPGGPDAVHRDWLTYSQSAGVPIKVMRAADGKRRDFTPAALTAELTRRGLAPLDATPAAKPVAKPFTLDDVPAEILRRMRECAAGRRREWPEGDQFEEWLPEHDKADRRYRLTPPGRGRHEWTFEEITAHAAKETTMAKALTLADLPASLLAWAVWCAREHEGRCPEVEDIGNWEASNDGASIRFACGDRAVTSTYAQILAHHRATQKKGKATTMATTETKTRTQRIKATLKADATDAGIRVAATQFVRLARDPLVAMLSRHLAPEDEAVRGKIAAFLATDAGTALLTGVLSLALSAVPAGAGTQAERIARELRVSSMSSAGDLVLEVVMQPLRQVMSMYLQDFGGGAALPAPTRVDLSADEPHVEYAEVEAVERATARAGR